MTRKLFLIVAILSTSLMTSCNNDSGRNEDDVTPPVATETPTPPPTPTPFDKTFLHSGKWGTTGLEMVVTSNHVDMNFTCAKGKVIGKIRLDGAGRFSTTGTISFFSNQTGTNETVPASYSGVVSDDQTVVTLTVTYTTPGQGGTEQRQDYVLRKNGRNPQNMCAF